MPELREVFEMTTKQVEPDVDAWREQPGRQRRSTRNKKIGAFALAASIVVLAVAVILGTRGGEDGSRPAVEPPTVAPSSASGSFFLDLGTGEQTPLAESLSGGYSYVASPDGTRLAYEIGGCEANSFLKIANIDGTDVRTIEPRESRSICAGARWSPDGTKLVYQERDDTGLNLGNLFVLDLSSGERTQVTDLELTSAEWWFMSLSFTPDGGNVIFHLPRGFSAITKWDVWSVPVTGGELTLVLRNAAFPMSTPGGQEIAFVVPNASNYRGGSIAIASTDGEGSRRTLVEANDAIWYPTMSPDGARIAYQDGGSIYVVDVSTGDVSEVAEEGDNAEWLDNDTLIVTPVT